MCFDDPSVLQYIHCVLLIKMTLPYMVQWLAIAHAHLAKVRVPLSPKIFLTSIFNVSHQIIECLKQAFGITTIDNTHD